MHAFNQSFLSVIGFIMFMCAPIQSQLPSIGQLILYYYVLLIVICLSCCSGESMEKEHAKNYLGVSVICIVEDVIYGLIKNCDSLFLEIIENSVKLELMDVSIES